MGIRFFFLTILNHCIRPKYCVRNNLGISMKKSDCHIDKMSLKQFKHIHEWLLQRIKVYPLLKMANSIKNANLKIEIKAMFWLERKYRWHFDVDSLNLFLFCLWIFDIRLQ